VSRQLKKSQIVEIPTFSHYQPHVSANQSKSSRKNPEKKNHEYFFWAFPADRLNSDANTSTPMPMNMARIDRAQPIAGTSIA
jgi:hypothetical protein